MAIVWNAPSIDDMKPNRINKIEIRVKSKEGMYELMHLLSSARLPLCYIEIISTISKDWAEVLSTMNFIKIREEKRSYWRWKNEEA